MTGIEPTPGTLEPGTPVIDPAAADTGTLVDMGLVDEQPTPSPEPPQQPDPDATA